MMIQPVILYGASGHAKVIIEILELNHIPVLGLFDDNPDIKRLLDYDVLGPVGKKKVKNPVIISIGDNLLRKKVSRRFNFSYAQAIHPTATISPRAVIGAGTVVMGHAIINSGTMIGQHCIINTSASIDHDCLLGDFVHISPNATLSGGVVVGEGTHIGSAAVVIPSVKIGKWATIGAGSVIIRDVPDFATVVGNPGRVIKTGSVIQQ